MGLIKIVLVEDDPYDVKLIASSVRRAGINAKIEVVETEEEFTRAGDCDVIISDFKLPRFSALRVLDLAGKNGINAPVIVVTGAIDDELAAECMRRGAADYLLKDRLARLGDAITAALDRLAIEKAKRQAEKELISDAHFRDAINKILFRSVTSELDPALFQSILEDLVRKRLIGNLVGARLVVPSLRIDALSGDTASAFWDRRSLSASGVQGSLDLFFAEGLPGKEDQDSVFVDEIVAIVMGKVRRYAAEQALVIDLAEKESLIRELNHRVKNNLTLIKALMDLERSEGMPAEANSLIERLEGHISAIASVHDLVYERNGYSSIDVKSLIEGIYRKDFGEAAPGMDAPALDIECEGLCVSLESAASLAIVIRELAERSRVAAAHGQDLAVSYRVAHEEGEGPERALKYHEAARPARKELFESPKFLAALVGQKEIQRPDGSSGLSFSIPLLPVESYRSC